MPVYDCEIEQHGRSKLTQRSEEEKDFPDLSENEKREISRDG